MRPSLRTPWVLVALTCLAAPLVACTESASRTFSFTSAGTVSRSLTFDDIAGSVHVTAGQGPNVTATLHVDAYGFDKQADAKAAASSVTIDESGDQQDMQLAVRGTNQGSGDFDIDIDLVVPPTVAVTIHTSDGDVAIDHLGVSVVDTTDAPVHLSFTHGSLVVRTNDGPVSLESHDGDCDVRTVDAPIDLDAVEGDVRATTTNGMITAHLQPPHAAEVLLATSNAEIDVTIPREFGAQLTALTSDRGIVAVDNLPFIAEVAGPDEARGAIGDGAGTLDARTTAGDITIEGR